MFGPTRSFSKGWYLTTNRCEATVVQAKVERQCRGSVCGKRDGLELCCVHLERDDVRPWPNPNRRDPN
ncbi:MAG: hypothetical protein GWO44_22210 [Thermoplasmata archaeon]|nr:hypothetical protein [Thermoplasmata archaeon]NIY05897.1 hypothetical protein [Thermoplasmata archaeon]